MPKIIVVTSPTLTITKTKTAIRKANSKFKICWHDYLRSKENQAPPKGAEGTSYYHAQAIKTGELTMNKRTNSRKYVYMNEKICTFASE